MVDVSASQIGGRAGQRRGRIYSGLESMAVEKHGKNIG